MKEVMTPELARQIVNREGERDRAALLLAGTQNPFGLQRLTLDLSTASTQGAPRIISFPFKSVYVESATDTNVNISLQPDTPDQFQGTITMKQNDSLSFGHPISKAYLTWSAQSNKTITLVFFVFAEFRPGSQVSITGGAIAISEGTSFTTTRVDLTAATAGAVVASLSTRRVASIQNNTGADVWFGGSSVSNTGANLGIKVAAGSTFQWRNTAALYAFSVAGGTGDNGLLVLEEVQ